MMDLRQALEAGCAAAFAIANPEDEHFFKIDQHGIVTSPQKLADKRYRWLDQNFKQRSDGIKAKKDLINNNQSHANVVIATFGRVHHEHELHMHGCSLLVVQVEASNFGA